MKKHKQNKRKSKLILNLKLKLVSVLQKPNKKIRETQKENTRKTPQKKGYKQK